MSARSFFGTNVLIYADDEAAPAKQRKAVNLVAEHRACEDRGGIAAGAAGVFRHGHAQTQVDAAIARRKVELLAEFDVAARAV